MSNEAITWCAKLHPGPGPKAVLFCLSDRATDHSGEDWTCFPSVNDIARFTDYGVRTVERHLATLWREGFISRRRRRRADGKLGIYDYWLHRDPDRRAELKAARAAVQDVEAAMESADDAACSPPDKLAGGPAASFAETTRQIVRQPPAKLAGQEPSVEPKDNPHSGGAREPGSKGFEDAVRLWPDSGQKRTRWPEGRAAWAFACQLETAERLMAAVKACAADPEIARGDYGWPGLHSWLSEERWRAWAPKAANDGGAVVAVRFAGPAELRADVLAVTDQAFVTGYLDRSAWGDGVVTPATGYTRDKLRLPAVAAVFQRHGVVLAEPAPAHAAQPVAYARGNR